MTTVGVHSETAEYMRARRPDWVVNRIRATAERADGITYRPYSHNGSKSNYVFKSGRQGQAPITALALMAEQEQRLGRKLRVLDIGTAAGGFTLRALQDGHEAYGLSLHDYRRVAGFGSMTRTLPKDAYVVGDAHDLVEIPEIPVDLDLVVSSWAFMHMVDPLSVLEQAADKLAQHGILATDYIANGDVYAELALDFDQPSVSMRARQGLGDAGFRNFEIGAALGEYTEQGTVNPAVPFIIDRASAAEPVRFAIDYRQPSLLVSK